MQKIRLQKYIAQSGYCSRRKAEEHIAAGAVRVNGEVIRTAGVSVDPLNDVVEVSGKRLSLQKHQYIALHKPVGYTCTTRSFKGEQNVLLLVPKNERWVIVGRLDKESEGLLLLTTDGDFAHQVMHPSKGMEKEYLVTVSKNLHDADLKKLAQGIQLEDGLVRPIAIRKMHAQQASVVLGEGKKREIRRMFAEIGYRVDRLQRVRIGNLKLGTLRAGTWRTITPESLFVKT